MKSQAEIIEDSFLKINNEIQVDLAGLAVEKNHPTEEEFLAWSEKYSKKFAEIIDAHPEYIGLYKHDRQKITDKISEELYGKGGVIWKNRPE